MLFAAYLLRKMKRGRLHWCLLKSDVAQRESRHPSDEQKVECFEGSLDLPVSVADKQAHHHLSHFRLYDTEFDRRDCERRQFAQLSEFGLEISGEGVGVSGISYCSKR
jgi:hypothetical protein